MKIAFLLTALLALLPISSAEAQSAADSAAIRAAALDYIEGWYEGNAERMQRALHPDLAKRIMERDRASGASRLQSMTAAQLVASTGRGGGSRTPAERRQKDVSILDVYENAASVKVVASDWIDYMHLARADDGRWTIVNVLWELKPARGRE